NSHFSATMGLRERLTRKKERKSSPTAVAPGEKGDAPQSSSPKLTDLVALNAEFEGSKDNAQANLDRKLQEALKARTGLHSENVRYTGTTYAVTLHLLRDGKRSEETIGGSSSGGVDTAIAAALEDKPTDYDTERIFVAVDRTAEAPYFTIPLRQRSVHRDGTLGRYREQAMGELRKAYGARLNDKPASVVYDAFILKKDKEYTSDGALPKGRFPVCDIAAHGRSNVSVDDAVAKAHEKLKKRNVGSTVHQETVSVMVYGAAEEALRLNPAGMSLPFVTTSDNGATIVASQKSGAGIKFVDRANYAKERASSGGSGYGRGGSPAARDVPQMPSLASLI
ncbi:hypothetical protein HYU19_03550, partial [Candidatus Woesearchaeota archaeon]|nr:hypothetical protein [Candidatus Woesearchaeota archaeon]